MYYHVVELFLRKKLLVQQSPLYYVVQLESTQSARTIQAISLLSVSANLIKEELQQSQMSLSGQRSRVTMKSGVYLSRTKKPK